MANPHFGNFGDVWKHIVLCESIARERPRYYWETHAGSASYPLSHSLARDYGVYYLLENGCRTSQVARSTYYEELTRFQSDQREENARAYPGSALLAMRILRDSASYLLCDVDERSARSLTDAAGGLGLGKHVQLAVQDGLAAVRDASHTFKGEPADVLVHIDPFDPCSETQPGLSALSLAADLGASGFKLILWYGYDSPADRALPWAPLATRGGSQWCGDLILRSNLNGGAPLAMSDISPLIGCGVVATNLRNSTAAALGSLGNDLVSLYEESLLPQTDTLAHSPSLNSPQPRSGDIRERWPTPRICFRSRVTSGGYETPGVARMSDGGAARLHIRTNRRTVTRPIVLRMVIETVTSGSAAKG